MILKKIRFNKFLIKFNYILDITKYIYFVGEIKDITSTAIVVDLLKRSKIKFTVAYKFVHFVLRNMFSYYSYNINFTNHYFSIL